jgi:hypothetical protein
MANIEEDLQSLKSFVQYLTLAYYTGSAKGLVSAVAPSTLGFWYSGIFPLSRSVAKSVLRELLPYVRKRMVSESWASTQKEQKVIRFVQMCSNGGRDPFPSTGFLEPWLQLSKALNRSPLFLLNLMLETSLALIGRINLKLGNLAWQNVASRDALRAALLPWFNECYAEPDLATTEPAISSVVIQEAFVVRHPHWRGKVAFPVEIPISRLELTSICEAVCPEGCQQQGARAQTAAYTVDGRRLDASNAQGPVIAEVFMDQETGELVNGDAAESEKAGRKLKSVLQARTI